MATYQESTSGTLPFYNEAMQRLIGSAEKQLAASQKQTAPQAQVAGLSPQQQRAIGLAQSNVGSYEPMTRSAEQAFNNAMGYYAGLTSGMDPALAARLQGITTAGEPLYGLAQQMGTTAAGAPLAEVGADLYRQAGDLYTTGGQFDPGSIGTYLNPYLSGVVAEIGRLGQERLEQQMLPALTGQFSSLGQFGSARQAAMLADAAKQSQREVLGTQSTALNTAYNQAMQDYLNWAQRQQSAAQGLTGLGAQQYQQLLGQSQLGMQGAGLMRDIGAQQAQQQQIAGQLGENAYQAAQNLALQQAQARAGTQLDVGSSLGNLAQARHQMSLADIGALSAAGQMQQQAEQAQMNAAYQNQLAQQQYPWQQLGSFSEVLKSAGTPQASTSWQTSFKKGGLARYADGGRFQEPDLIEDQLQQLLAPSTGSPNYVDQALGARQQFLSRAQSSPAFADAPEPSFGEAAGQAMMRAAAQGPANLGQLIGRSGESYFDAEKERQVRNRETSLNRLLLEQKALPPITAGAVRSGSGPSPEQVRTVYTSARNEAAQIAKDYQFPTAEARSTWIEQQAMGTVENYLQNFATQPIGPRGGSLPLGGTPPLRNARAESVIPPQQAPGSQGGWPTAYNEPHVKFDSPTPGLASLDMRGTPESVRAELQSLSEPDRTEALRSLEASQAPRTPVGASQVPSPPLRDKRAEQYKQAYGGEEGKALFKERENLNTLYGTNASMVNQLNLLENLYSNPNLPEGELGPLIQKIRSGFQSFGVDVGETTGPADLANAVAQKMVLAQRTSDGTNLLPGAVSNFEVQLLQSMGPTLSLTNEGRQALVRFMKEVALSNQRIAEEGSTFAAQNQDMLTPGWYKRKERVMLEEMAKMKRLSDRIMLPFGNQERGAQ